MADVVLESSKKKKEVIKDENGYYKVTFGSLNAFNRNGIYYLVKDFNKIFGPDSIIGKRIDMGLLRAEYDHPETPDDPAGLKQRTLLLDKERICAHIKKIELYNTGKVAPGFNKPEYKVYGWIKPEGPYGKYLEEALENPEANVAFSIRSLCKQYMVGGVVVREPVIVSTWDYVTDPGYATATQWDAVGNESHISDVVVDDSDIEELIKAYETHALKCQDGKCVLEGLKYVRTKRGIDIVLGE